MIYDLIYSGRFALIHRQIVLHGLLFQLLFQQRFVFYFALNQFQIEYDSFHFVVLMIEFVTVQHYEIRPRIVYCDLVVVHCNCLSYRVRLHQFAQRIDLLRSDQSSDICLLVHHLLVNHYYQLIVYD